MSNPGLKHRMSAIVPKQLKNREIYEVVMGTQKRYVRNWSRDGVHNVPI